MKRSIIFSLLISVFFVSCRKEDNPILPDFARVPLPLITLDPTSDATISGQNADAFVGKIIVDLYFKSDIKPQKFDIVIRKNGISGNVKMVQQDVTTFPTTIQITGAQIAALFGEAIVAGDTYDVGADVFTTSGQKFEAFPLTGISYDASILGQPGSSPSVQFPVLCGFDKNSFNGDYSVTQDDWADFNPGDLIQVKPGTGDNQILVYAYPSPMYGKNRKPMVLDVDPVTNLVTVAEQVIGDYDGAPPGATARGTGSVNPCGSKITLSITLNVAGDDYEGNVLILEK